MIKNKYVIITAIVLVAGLVFFFSGKETKKAEVSEEAVVYKGTIKTVISSTGTVLPQNRLQILPPLNGRVDRILVKEGDVVRAGTIVAWMSSYERAALIDSARASGDNSVQYWTDAYKPIPIVAPITGTVIVRAVEQGQTITILNSILVLSDRLIIKADVDETDIGRVRVGQKAIISLDAYPDIKVNARVDHISYESTIINNVTMYKVDVLPDSVPAVFRSGMSANVDIIESIKENALLVPLKAVYDDKNGGRYVLLKNKNIQKRSVKTGIVSDNEIEIVDGLRENDIIVINNIQMQYLNPEEKGTNPFRPQFRKKK